MICEHLAPLLEHELSKGNAVSDCETGWSAVNLAMSLENHWISLFMKNI